MILIMQTKEENKMAEMQGRTLAVPADGKMICCIEASRKNRHRSSSAGLSWYFAQRAMPGLVYAATMNGYVASGPDKGGK
jgi:hypothetical protein